MEDGGRVQSLFLAGLMIGSVMLGMLFVDLEEQGENRAPEIEGEIPNEILIGTIDMLQLSISDEDMSSLDLYITLNAVVQELELNQSGFLNFDISELEVGEHVIKIIATDSLGQESRYTSSFRIHYPHEDPTVVVMENQEITIEEGNSTTVRGTVVHPDLSTCEAVWISGNSSEAPELTLPIEEGGVISLGFDDLSVNRTITVRATCGTWEDSVAEQVVQIIVVEAEDE